MQRDLPDPTRWLSATGVRIGEAIAVDWSSIDLDHATVEIDYKVMQVKRQGLVRLRRTKSDAGHHPAAARLRRTHARTPDGRLRRQGDAARYRASFGATH